MERYLQVLVIALPALTIAMGGLLLVIFMWRKTSPVSRSSATTQSDEPVHVCVIDHEIQDKLVDEVMAKVRTFLVQSSTKISQEEADKTKDSDRTDEKRRRAEMEIVCNMPGMAPLNSVTATNSFASLWVKELQKSGEIVEIPPQNSRDSSLHRLTQREASEEMVEVKPCKIDDLEMVLLTTSSNLCRSIMAYAMDYKPGDSNEEICMRPDVPTTRVAAPQLLKGGASSNHGDPFVWRLDIEDNCAEPSPPNTPVRLRPQHLCRGVQFQVAEHPPAMNIIHLDPAQGYGWRGPDWKETFGKHHIFKEHEGPSEYRKRKQNLASDHSKAKYYKSVEADARRKWKGVKERYRRAKEAAVLRAAIHEDIHRSAEWRRQLREKASYQSSSPDTQEREGEERSGKVKSMLATSSSSNDSNDSMIARFHKMPNCKRKHRHCRT